MAHKKEYAEKALEWWLFNNLSVVEKGLQPIARQFRYPLINRRFNPIDILAVDRLGRVVLIEVKLYANKNAVSQLESYKKDFHMNCRTILIAWSFKDNLKIPKGMKTFQVCEETFNGLD